jgi:hypothetical protein
MSEQRQSSDERSVQQRQASELAELEEDAGLGVEDVTAEEQLTPILRILHYQCPQIDPNDLGYVPNAKPGMLYNIATRETFDGNEGLDIIVCGRQRRYTEWLPRGSALGGGGFRGFHEAREPIIFDLVRKYGQFAPLHWTNDKGEEVDLIETGELFVLYAPPPLTIENAHRAIVNFTSKSLSVYKSYISRHMQWQIPGQNKPRAVFAYRWRLTSKATSNAKGKFFVWALDLAPPAGSPTEALVRIQDPMLYQTAKASWETYQRGQVRYTPDEAVTDGEDPPF